ncbi:MAG: CvpA family protein [Acidobacteriota bacterium]|nr:CvpA family protein [Acidobacteriota bacterium]
MNWIDVLLFLIVAFSVWGGWMRGFILGGLDLLRWICSLLAALFFYQRVAEWLGSVNDWKETWNQPFAFIMIMLGVSVVLIVLSNLLVRRLPRDIHRKQLNRVLGTIPGLFNGLITAAIIAALLFAIPVADGLHQAAQESRIANRLAVITDEAETRLVPIFNDAIKQTFNRLMIEPGSNETVDLPFRVANVHERPDLEAQMLELINQERAQVGLAPLEADDEMRGVARKHSTDMFARGYFSHHTLERKSPFDRMREDNVRFVTAGENLALAPTLQIAHRGLMNSPGHRANILRPQFGRVGIGIMDGGIRGLMVTQNFRN